MKNKLCAALVAVALAIGFFAILSVNNVTATTIGDQYTLTVNVDGTGCSVTENATQDTYNYGDAVQLTPVAASGWSFSGWSGDLNSTDNPATVTLESNMTITATFTQDTYALTMYTDGQGTVSPGNQTYASGTVVDLQAMNEENWAFSGWSGDVTDITNTTVTMDGNKTVTATFTLNDNSASPTPTPTPSPTPTATPTPTPSPTATPKPSATATPSPAPTSTPKPTTTTEPTSTPKPTQASIGTYLAIIGAAIILVILAIGLFAKRKKHFPRHP